MFEFDWQSRRLWAMEKSVTPGGPTRLARERAARTMLLHWQEHCLECAPPQCYASCLLYAPRADRKCARLVYGFARNPAFAGLFDEGADVRFRRWGKLESKLRPGSVGVAAHRLAAMTDRMATSAVNLLSGLLLPLSPFRRLNGALTWFREQLLHRMMASPVDKGDYDEFVLECFLPDASPTRLLLELWNGGALAFRRAIPIEPGPNFVTIPAEAILGGVDWPRARLTLYPENDAEVRLIFTWLDFVKYPAAVRSVVPSAKNTSAETVKCVAWDLDNTLWRGVLVEDGPDKIVAREEALDLIRRLDERGILQTVVSKNDFASAMAVIRRLGLEKHLLCPAINWRAKSANLRDLARRLNLGVDSFALIDDSAFERAEVLAALPTVRVYTETQINDLLTRPEFDVPVTEMSRVRRQAYLVEEKREEVRQKFANDYAGFLRSCGMRLRVFAPREPAVVLRCHELVQRSNQLNLSSRRYTRAEFDALLDSPGVLNVALHCADKFGDYGIVGFVSVEERAETVQVTNFVLSCRVAQKRVEHAFFRWLASRAQGRGRDKLQANLIVTDRNGPLMAVFDELGFRRTQVVGERVAMELTLAAVPADDGVVALTVELPT